MISGLLSCIGAPLNEYDWRSSAVTSDLWVDINSELGTDGPISVRVAWINCTRYLTVIRLLYDYEYIVKTLKDTITM